MSTTIVSQSTNSVPEPIAKVADLMSSYPGSWALSGGWAVDAWLGHVTRDHGDIDIVVFDQGALFEYLPGWQLLAHDPDAPDHDGEWWDGRRVLNHRSHIHSRPPELSGSLPEGGIATAGEGFTLEFQLNERSGEDWVLRRRPMISLPLSRAVWRSRWSVPTVAPEVVLFYKAADLLRHRDKVDFQALLPHLTGEQRDWLRAAIALVGHPWLSQLAT